MYSSLTPLCPLNISRYWRKKRHRYFKKSIFRLGFVLFPPLCFLSYISNTILFLTWTPSTKRPSWEGSEWQMKKKIFVKPVSSSDSILHSRLSQSIPPQHVLYDLLRCVRSCKVNFSSLPHVDSQEWLRRDNQNISKLVVMILIGGNSTETDTTENSCCLRPTQEKVFASS